MFEAQTEAAKIFKAKKRWLVNIHLAAQDNVIINHKPMF
jgi:hypothetical protein